MAFSRLFFSPDTVRTRRLRHSSGPRRRAAFSTNRTSAGRDGDGQMAFSDGPWEVVHVPDGEWESQTASCDEPWEVTYANGDVDAFEAAF